MFLLLAFLLNTSPDAGAVSAAKPASVVINGVGLRPGALTPIELETGATTATWKSHGESHQVRGVPLDSILRQRGFSPGAMGPDVSKDKKREGYKKVVVVTARDGYQAVFSAAEITSGMGATRVMVVSSVDGKPLGPDIGPIRLVVLTDEEPSRCIRQVERVDLVDPRSLVPTR